MLQAPGLVFGSCAPPPPQKKKLEGEEWRRPGSAMHKAFIKAPTLIPGASRDVVSSWTELWASQSWEDLRLLVLPFPPTNNWELSLISNLTFLCAYREGMLHLPLHREDKPLFSWVCLWAPERLQLNIARRLPCFDCSTSGDSFTLPSWCCHSSTSVFYAWVISCLAVFYLRHSYQCGIAQHRLVIWLLLIKVALFIWSLQRLAQIPVQMNKQLNLIVSAAYSDQEGVFCGVV